MSRVGSRLRRRRSPRVVREVNAGEAGGAAKTWTQLFLPALQQQLRLSYHRCCWRCSLLPYPRRSRRRSRQRQRAPSETAGFETTSRAASILAPEIHARRPPYALRVNPRGALAEEEVREEVVARPSSVVVPLLCGTRSFYIPVAFIYRSYYSIRYCCEPVR